MGLESLPAAVDDPASPDAGVVWTPSVEFDEDEWFCPAVFRAAYNESIARGRDRMARSRVVICGIARDLGEPLRWNLPRIRRIAEPFRDARFVFYENDSVDDTRERLEAWAREDPRVSVLSERLGAPRWGSVPDPARARDLAACREKVRRHAVREAGDFDFAIVLDPDLCGFSYDGIAHSLGQDDWDALGANGLAPRWGRPIYWDTWAFRALGHPDVHGSLEVSLMVLPRGAPLLPVLSCFGGLALYRMAAFAAAAYGGDECEHVTLHKRMCLAGYPRVFLNPSLIVLYPDHLLSHDVRRPFWWRKRASSSAMAATGPEERGRRA